MKYIGERNQEVSSSDPTCAEERIFEFSVTKKDFFLGYKGSWDIIVGDVFEFIVKGAVYLVPSKQHIVIGDEYGDIDFIEVDEAFNRPIDFVQLDKDMMNWSIGHPTLVNFHHDMEVFWPMSKNIIPIQDKEKIILVSDRDHYGKFKDEQVEVFTSV